MNMNKSEVFKGVIYKKEDVTINGRKLQKYIIALTVVTDLDMELDNCENVVYSANITAELSPILKKLKKYEPPFNLGSIESALINIPHINIDELKEK